MSNIYFLSFATSNWKQSKPRYKRQLDFIQSKFQLFKDIYLYNEKDLKKEYWDYIKDKITVKDGFYLWSWKPYIILDILDKINDGDYLLYMDGGCSLSDAWSFNKSKSILLDKCSKLNNDIFIALTYIQHSHNCPIKIQIRKELLEEVKLDKDDYFLNKYNHYQSGVILLYKCDKSVQLIKDWYEYYNLYYK